jgi:asparagine synthetase A
LLIAYVIKLKNQFNYQLKKSLAVIRVTISVRVDMRQEHLTGASARASFQRFAIPSQAEMESVFLRSTWRPMNAERMLCSTRY